MIIEVPQTVLKDGGMDWKFDTAQFQVNEENIDAQAMKIANSYSEWSYVAARLHKNLLDLERKYSEWEPKAIAIVEAEARSIGIKYNSEKAKTNALFTHKGQDGTNDFAERILQYQNIKDELVYYIDLVENAVLKSLSIQKDMIITLGANLRAGMNVQTNAV